MSLTLELCLGYAGASIPQGPCNKFCLGGIAPCACQGFFLALATLAHLAGSSCQLVSVALPWCPKSAWEKQLLLNSWEKQPVKSGMANPKAWGAYVKQARQLPGNAPPGANIGTHTQKYKAAEIKLWGWSYSTPRQPAATLGSLPNYEQTQGENWVFTKNRIKNALRPAGARLTFF